MKRAHNVAIIAIPVAIPRQRQNQGCQNSGLSGDWVGIAVEWG